MSNRGAVELSEGFLIGCRSEECIDYVVMHELGHACEDRRSRGSDRVVNQCAIDLGLASEERFERIFGSAARQCVVREIESYAVRERAAGWPVCRGMWNKVAFADARASTRLRHFSSWSRICEDRGDPGHAGGLHYIHCIANHPLNRSRYCAGTGNGRPGSAARP
jgi:hypothetical protein